MESGTALDENGQRSLALGSLCVVDDDTETKVHGGDFPVLSRERWNFWKQRLVEILGSLDEPHPGGVELGDRIHRTLQAMKAAEAGRAVVE